jgi:hypothetical protein
VLTPFLFLPAPCSTVPIFDLSLIIIELITVSLIAGTWVVGLVSHDILTGLRVPGAIWMDEWGGGGSKVKRLMQTACRPLHISLTGAGGIYGYRYSLCYENHPSHHGSGQDRPCFDALAPWSSPCAPVNCIDG